MTQDEIIEMARQVGFKVSGELVLDDVGYVTIHHRLGDFAKMVAAKEREACIEACKKTITNQRSAWGANFCIEAIRARGQGTPERGQA
jgi:hypothetical protein